MPEKMPERKKPSGKPRKSIIWSVIGGSPAVLLVQGAVHGLRTGRGRWDYADEAPLRDARGFEMSRMMADPSQLTDEDPTMANVVLTNGPRLYVDHAHPEYSSPEVTSPRAAVTWDRAGEVLGAQIVDLLAQDPGAPAINLYKNNTDGKGASYGTHENYLMRRSTPFGRIARDLIPFFVVRQLICGAGRVGIGQDSRTAGFQISQRADFFEVEVGLETTLKRPIVNTRDEPHAEADRFRRLHVIIGDAVHFDVAGLLRVGTTSLVLSMIEAGVLPDLTLRRPVGTLHEISHDPTLRRLVELADGRRMRALDLLWVYHDAAAAYLARDGGSPDTDTAEVMTWWAQILTRLGEDPMSCAAEIDWVAKLRLLEGYRDRDGLGWGDARLAAVDLQFAAREHRRERLRRADLHGRARVGGATRLHDAICEGRRNDAIHILRDITGEFYRDVEAQNNLFPDRVPSGAAFAAALVDF